METTKKTKVKRIVLGSVAGLLVAITIFLLVWFFGARYPQFDGIAQADAPISYLKDGAVPQGLCTLPENEDGYDFLMSAYMVDDSPSRLCLLDSEGQKSKYVTVKQGDKLLTSHFGGVTLAGEYLHITSGKSVVRVALSDVLSAEDGATVEVKDSFKTGIQNAFCYYFENRLYVGEFYRKGNYETDVSHHLTENGETNYAFIYVFETDETQEGGVKSTVPVQVISVRGLVQGIAVLEDKIYLSTSYGLPNSELFIYENILDTATDKTATVGENQIPLYRLDSTNLQKSVEMPCMSEEICVKDGKLFVLFESNCNKYKYFTRTRVKTLFALALSELNK